MDIKPSRGCFFYCCFTFPRAAGGFAAAALRFWALRRGASGGQGVTPCTLFPHGGVVPIIVRAVRLAAQFRPGLLFFPGVHHQRYGDNAIGDEHAEEFANGGVAKQVASGILRHNEQ